jgi:hypothetical protein
MTAAFIDFEEWEDMVLRYQKESLSISFQEWLGQQTFDNPPNKPYSPNKLMRQLTFNFMENTDGGHRQKQEEARENVRESCETENSSY